jgi:hypothetical protein
MPYTSKDGCNTALKKHQTMYMTATNATNSGGTTIIYNYTFTQTEGLESHFETNTKRTIAADNNVAQTKGDTTLLYEKFCK